jgi:hypothetical protein
MKIRLFILKFQRSIELFLIMFKHTLIQITLKKNNYKLLHKQTLKDQNESLYGN